MNRFADSIVVPLDAEAARYRLHAILSGLPRVKDVYIGVSVVEARTRIGLESFGETITCTLRPEGAGTRVDAVSCSVVPMTAVDWGVNRGNIRLLMAELGLIHA